MEARLKAIMEMDASEVQKELIKTANELKKFERELAKSTDTKRIGELTSKISELNSKMNQLAPAMSKVGNATTAVGGAMSKSQTNAMNFARVIQDLPFGFIGIQNNLTQLIPGIGAAGIAFSALTSAITFSQVGLTYWTKKGKEAKDAADEFLTVTRNANKTAAEELVNSRLLYQAATNTADAMDMRLRAAKELIKLYPQTFANYTAEEIALGKAEEGYKKLTAAIVANARAVAAKNKITEIEADIMNREDNIRKINAITKAQKEAAKTTTSGGTMGAAVDISTAESKRAQIEARRLDALKKEQYAIDVLIAKRKFYESFAGTGNLQQSVVPPPTTARQAGSNARQPDGELARMTAMSNDFQQKKGKNWWRNTQTERGANLTMQDTTKLALGENKQLNQILAERGDIQRGLNEQMAQANGIAEYGGAVFGQMAMAMMQGTSIGDVLATTFKNLVSQLIQAVAQAAIFAAIMSAISPGTSFGTLFSSGFSGGGGSGAMNILGMISGQNIQLSNNRTGTGMGYRRGRR